MTPQGPVWDGQPFTIRAALDDPGGLAQRPRLSTPDALARYIGPHLAQQLAEHVVLCVLGGDLSPLTISSLGHGSPFESPIDLRGLAREILTVVAWSPGSSVVVAHNHPNDWYRFSYHDWRATRTMRRIVELVDMRWLDHLLVTPSGRWLSWRLLHDARTTSRAAAGQARTEATPARHRAASPSGATQLGLLDGEPAHWRPDAASRSARS